MKKYFEYNFNDKIKDKLLKYYENTDLGQHNQNHKIKAKLKIDRILPLIKLKESDSIIDIGCSSGFFLNFLSKNVKTAKGIDISSNIIELNKKNKNFGNNISFDIFDGENLLFDEKFNKIFLIDVLEHAFNPNKLIENIYKILDDNGELIIEVPFSGWLSEIMFGKYHQGHLRYYDDDYLSKYLHKYGFGIKPIKIYNSVPFSSLFLKFKPLWNVLDFIINLIPPKYYPYFGEIIIVASKKENND